jgi:hypothetical protein
MRENIELSWVPLPVCEMAVAMWRIDAESRPPSGLRKSTERQDAILRLAGDFRMQTVWNELLKKHHRVNAPVALSHWHKICGKPANLVDKTPDEIALALFFHRATLLAIADIVEREAEMQHSPSRAEQLRFEADYLDAVEGLENRISEQCAAILEFGSRLCDDFLPIDADLPAIQRDHGNRRVRFSANLLASVTSQLYGEVLHGTIATTVNVALNLKGKQQITRRDVKNWWSRDWAHKNQK